MSPIENVVPTLADEATDAKNLEIRNKQDRTRDLFGIQLEVSFCFVTLLTLILLYGSLKKTL